MTTVTGAVVQAGSVLFDKKHTMQKFADLASDDGNGIDDSISIT